MRALSMSLSLLLLAAGCTQIDETDETGATEETGQTVVPFDPPEWCPSPAPGLVEILDTPAAPYFLVHPEPEPAVNDAPMVVFLPGGPQDQGSAMGLFASAVGKPEGREAFRVVVPYGVGGAPSADRVVSIREEVLLCWGGREDQVHLAGHSSGGYASFSLMLERPELFRSLLGAPGTFPTWDETAVKAALSDKSVFNGVGETDSWKTQVKQTHDLLVAAGIDSTYVEFAGEGHVLSPEFDEGVFYEFWSTH